MGKVMNLKINFTFSDVLFVIAAMILAPFLLATCVVLAFAIVLFLNMLVRYIEVILLFALYLYAAYSVYKIFRFFRKKKTK